MKCALCQHENRPGAKFCEQCATPLARACTNCGAQLSPTAKFCSECGHPAHQGGPTGPRFGAPETYTPKHLVEKILTSRTALEGERKQVTVLFADLKSSMELLADRDPEEARRLLDPVLEHMMEAVHRYEGTVNQVMGDGIMALFGAPVAHEDHAVRACYAALRMQETVRRYAEGVRRQEGITVRIRVGLNSGEVVVRAIGSDLHMDYTAVGQTTHLAARMEQLADPGTALLTPATLALAEAFIQVRPLGPTPVKGLPEPVEIYEITGATPVRSRFQAHAARGLTTFVGRTIEMTQLAEALDLAKSGRGQVVAVVGEPGVGKSRLFWEFGHSHRAEGCLVLESASVSYGKATTYLPVIELLRAYFQIAPRDDPRKIRERVTGSLLSLDRALEMAVAPLSALIDLPVEDPEWAQLDPVRRRQRTLDAVKRLLLRETQVQPLVVVFEDLHWIDGETQAVLDGLVESLPTVRLLLLVNYRPEYRHAWGSKTYYRQLRIDTLPAASAEDLLRALLGHDPSLAPLERLLIERAEGNPLFLEESVRTLAETRILAGARGAYRLARVPGSLDIPPTAQAIIAARVDRLEPDDKRLLQAAAVVGKDVPFSLLAAIADLPEDELRQRLARLQAAEFLYEAPLFPEVEYTFKHALTHQVTYESLLNERRRILHATIMEAIEEASAERRHEQVEHLAHHAVRAERWERAVYYLREAGNRAVRQSANVQAAAHFEHALAALERLPRTDANLGQAIEIRIAFRTPLYVMGEMETLGTHLAKAQELAEALGDPIRRGWAATWMASHLHTLGRPQESRRLAEANLAFVNTIPDVDVDLMFEALVRVGYARITGGSHQDAAQPLRAAVELLKSSPHASAVKLQLPWSVPVGWLAALSAELGEFDEGIQQAESAASIARDFDVPFGHVHAAWALLYVRVTRGMFREAVQDGAQAVAQAREQVRGLAPYVLQLVGYANALTGRPEGVGLLVEALETRDAQRIGMYRSLNLSQLAHAHLLAGDQSKAREVAEAAVTSARERGERGQEAHALRVHAETTAAAGPGMSGRAEDVYRQALVLAQELGMRPLVAHCHLGLGSFYVRTGRHHQAREHLATATTMYREMDMRFWLEQSERGDQGPGCGDEGA